MAAIRAAQLGAKVTLIEKQYLGGTCLNVGCIPTKCLLHSAELVEQIKTQGKDIGVEVEGVKVNFPQVIAHKNAISKQLTSGVAGLLKLNKVKKVDGTAKFTGEKQLEVTKPDGSKESMTADAIIVATGSVNAQPPIPGLKETRHIEATWLLTHPEELADTDRRIVVVGGGDSVAAVESYGLADKMGYIPNVGPKIEYFYSDSQHELKPKDDAGYFDLTPMDNANDLRRQTTLMLEKMSIPVQYSYHAAGPSQNGVELRFTEAVSCADNIVTARLVIKQLAAQQGMYASFMPKPVAGQPGSAMFLYQSLFSHEGENLFWAPKDYHVAHLSDLAQHYVAGILKYAPEFTLVTNPTVNSYKRFISTGEVPNYATWGRKNRSALVRIPAHKPGKHVSTRIELRSPDPTANPYLALAATIAAGLKGIEEELPLPEESTRDTFLLSQKELEARGIKRLPRTLGEAIQNFEESELMREVLGDHIFDYLVQEKKHEWNDYCTAVTDWEREHYYGGY